MMSKLIPLCTHRLSRKCAALLLGYVLWFSLHQELIKTVTVPLPLYFLNAESVTIQAPETIACTVQSKSKFFKNFMEQVSCIYVDAQTLPKNKSFVLNIGQQQVHLPAHVSMIHCSPTIITLTQNPMA